jgi:hypothetical protein
MVDHQHHQHLQRFWLDLENRARTPQLQAVRLQFELTEAVGLSHVPIIVTIHHDSGNRLGRKFAGL